MPKKPCNCPNCKGTLRDPKTIKAHTRKVQALLTAQKVWQDKNEHAKRRAADTNEEYSGERHSSDDEGSAGSEDGQLERPQKRCRTLADSDDLNTQVSVFLVYLSKSLSECP